MKGFNDIDTLKPLDCQVVIGYCEPIYGSDFEAKLTYRNGEFYHKGKTVRCYFWKSI